MIVLRKQKGAPLTSDELDQNFQELNERLTHLETHPSQGEGIAHIAQKNDIIEIFGTFGTLLGRVTLPKMLPFMKGSWKKGKAYMPNDWVIRRDKTYVCCHAHTSEKFALELEACVWKEVITTEETTGDVS